MPFFGNDKNFIDTLAHAFDPDDSFSNDVRNLVILLDIKLSTLFEKNGVPYLATYIFILFMNAPGLGTGIDPDMALTPFSSCDE